jgi:hypothetical protein
MRAFKLLSMKVSFSLSLPIEFTFYAAVPQTDAFRFHCHTDYGHDVE